MDLHRLFADSEFWVLVAFVIAIGFLVYKAKPIVTGALDQRASKIKAELDEARRLREEAQKSLAEYQRKQRDALKEAEGIVAHARSEAERAGEQAGRDLAAALERRQRQALEKIALAESKAMAEVRDAAVDIAIAALRQVMEQDLDSQRRAALIDEAIAALPPSLH